MTVAVGQSNLDPRTTHGSTAQLVASGEKGGENQLSQGGPKSKKKRVFQCVQGLTSLSCVKRDWLSEQFSHQEGEENLTPTKVAKTLTGPIAGDWRVKQNRDQLVVKMGKEDLVSFPMVAGMPEEIELPRKGETVEEAFRFALELASRPCQALRPIVLKAKKLGMLVRRSNGGRKRVSISVPGHDQALVLELAGCESRKQENQRLQQQADRFIRLENERTRETVGRTF